MFSYSGPVVPFCRNHLQFSLHVVVHSMPWELPSPHQRGSSPSNHGGLPLAVRAPALALISRGRAMCVAEATWADGRGPALRLRLMPGTWLLYSHMTVLDSVLDRQIYLSPCHGDMLGWLHRSCAIDTWLAEIRTQHRSD
jgi:hypothetical protein